MRCRWLGRKVRSAQCPPIVPQLIRAGCHLVRRNRVRLYSTKTFKALGTLSYHTKSCQALAFARTKPAKSSGQSGAQGFTPNTTSSVDDIDDVDDELTPEELAARNMWLVCGSQDDRISVWQLMSFEKAPANQKA